MYSAISEETDVSENSAIREEKDVSGATGVQRYQRREETEKIHVTLATDDVLPV